ncbi:MAG: 1-deoxy-D-xylulose-5-phosphate synthase [Candidatus Krumholzibacteriota bacterium]|nr:1-deoxy-D-xylulose-5-phosphate synthase [Candidatus Krumholzibacteriota bacterium]
MYLKNIDSPSDIKNLSISDLEVLAGEIRRYIIETVSIRGGHLASSLGTVEITLALHYIFNSPEDKIVWDVGHQSYAHKILTGRREAFRDLRIRGGISGFPNIYENEHDSFGVGHACTAISAALGFAVARDLRGKDNFVISVVGDGSISGGLSQEGINQAGHLKKNRFVIILNDNEMSISKNVGALAKYLTRITTKKPYLQIESDVWELLGKIPSLGGKARTLASRIKESIKNLVVPTILFEELGFRYLGPLDGHDIEELVDTFSNLHQLPGPVLVHVITKKGKGYPFAEKDAEKFHGIGSFYKATGDSKSVSEKEKYSKVFGRVLSGLARKDDKIVAITAAMKEGTGLACFAEEFPGRFFDVGISEPHAVTFAAGLAKEGYKPFVAIYSTFLQRSFDQIIHDVALQRLPVRFVLDRAGIVGEDGPTHHGNFDLSYMNMIPGMTIMAPSDEVDMERMLGDMVSHESGPVMIRFPRGNVPEVRSEMTGTFPEKGRGVIVREGKDSVVYAIGSMVNTAIAAANILSKEGIELQVINARFAKPLDELLIRETSMEKNIVFTLEENVKKGGFGDSVRDLLSELRSSARLIKLGINDRFVPHGKRDQLLEETALDEISIARIIGKELRARSLNDNGG